MNSFKMMKMLWNKDDFTIERHGDTGEVNAIRHDSGVWWIRSIGCVVISREENDYNDLRWRGFLGGLLFGIPTAILEINLYNYLDAKFPVNKDQS